jgi:hypothetical protein
VPATALEIGHLDQVSLEVPPFRLMYGYLRLPESVADVRLISWCRSMRTYCEANGYDLVDIYVDGDNGSDRSFAALLEELMATGARDVVVPELDRLHPHPAVRGVLLDRIRGNLNARLHCLHAYPERTGI